MSNLRLPLGLLALFALAVPLHAQTLADAAKAEAVRRAALPPVPTKVYTNADLPPVVVVPPEPPLTAAERADIRRSNFDRVYVAGKAVRQGQYGSVVGVSPRQFQQLLLTFQTELSITLDTVVTKGEKFLAGQYELAYLKFDLGARQGGATWTETMTAATTLLDAANDLYLGKPAK